MMISVVIPLLNEGNLVDELLKEVFAYLQKIQEDFEVVCVDDGSTDSTLKKLLDYREKDKRLKIISLSRNFGLQAAMTAGLDKAKGEYIIIMDGDFQDPPELLPVLYKKIEEGKADIVTAVRDQRNERLTRKVFTDIFHRLFSQISEEKQVANAGNFCILNKKAHKAILEFSERNRYLPGIRNFVGFKHEFIEFDRPVRLKGKAKMGRRKLLALAADAIYSFSKWPIKLCLYFGILGIVLFLGAIVYTLVSKFMGFAPIGWSSTFIAVCFFGSVQLTFLGVIGEYIYRIFKEVQNRPVYIIKEVYE